MAESTESRIDRMHGRDRAWALVALVTLWLTICFVFFKVAGESGDPQIIAALAGGAGALLILNTASIIALLRHYENDKAHLYGLDIFYVDAMRAAAKGERHVA